MRRKPRKPEGEGTRRKAKKSEGGEQDGSQGSLKVENKTEATEARRWRNKTEGKEAWSWGIRRKPWKPEEQVKSKAEGKEVGSRLLNKKNCQKFGEVCRIVQIN